LLNNSNEFFKKRFSQTQNAIYKAVFQQFILLKIKHLNMCNVPMIFYNFDPAAKSLMKNINVYPMKKIFLLLFLLLSATVNKGQETVSNTDSISVSEKSKGFIILPLVYYTPDTRWASGAMGAYYFKTAGRNSNEATRLSYIKGLADYTQNRQVDLWSSWSIFLRDENYIVKGHFRYRNFPDRFYGIGNNSLEVNEERYQYDLFSLRKYVLRKIKKDIFLGVDYEFKKMYNMKTFGPILSEGSITGSKGGINSGAGLVLLVDKRDNVINATKGYFLEASSYYFGKAIGSDFSFANYNLTFNTYKAVRKNHIIATNTVMGFNTGDPPFIDYMSAGSENILRGYAENRFKDKNLLATQVEYRFPVYRRFGAVVFTGLGDIFNQWSDLQLNLVKYSYGAGLRFCLDRKENLNLRFDYGFGRDNHTFYFIITEAF
jgi:hemolysin activation/secretion protein